MKPEYSNLLPACHLGAGGYVIDWNRAESLVPNVANVQAAFKEALVVQPQGFNDKIPPPWYSYSIEGPMQWKLPRFWAIENIGLPKALGFQAVEKPMLSQLFKGEVRSNQEDACQFLLQLLQKTDGEPTLRVARFNLFTGWGKTFFAMYAAKLLGTRTLIVSHKTVLLDQYRSEIDKFFDSESIKVGMVKAGGAKKKCDPRDISYDIVLSTVQSILKVNQPIDTFGLVIIDEVHHYASEFFSTVNYKVNAPVIIGLSADKERSDKLDYVIDAHLGPYIYTEEPKNDQTSRVDVHAFRCSTTPKVKQAAYKDEIGWMEKMNAMCVSAERNEFIAHAVKHFADQDPHIAQRHLLLLCKNKDQVDDLHARLTLLMEPQTRILQWTGDRKNRKMTHAEAANAQILVATYGMLGEGVSLDLLDTLIICSQNKMNMNQAFGRILRRKFDFPYVVIDFDDVNFFPGMFSHRLKQYRERLPGTQFTINRWEKDDRSASKIIFRRADYTPKASSRPALKRSFDTMSYIAPLPTIYKT